MLGDLANLVASVYAAIDIAITRLETHARNVQRREMLEFYLLYSQYLLSDSHVYTKLKESPLPIAQLLLHRISCWCTQVMSLIERISRCQSMRKKVMRSGDIDLEISQLETSYQSILLMIQSLGIQFASEDAQRKLEPEPGCVGETPGFPVAGVALDGVVHESVARLKEEYSKLCESGIGVRAIQEKVVLAALERSNHGGVQDEAGKCSPTEHLEKTLRNLRPPPPTEGLKGGSGDTSGGGGQDVDTLMLESRMHRLKTDVERLQFGEMIGKGAFGDVYRGVRDGVCRVALKVISSASIFSSEERREVFGEIFALRMASHENIVRLLGFSEVPERGLVLILELCTCSLGSLLTKIRRVRSSRETGPWLSPHRHQYHHHHHHHYNHHDGHEDLLKPWEESLLESLAARLQLGCQLVSAVHYLHNICSPSIVHRDIKSANVLLHCVPTEEGDLQVIGKLCDFGMAKICSFVTSHQGSFQDSVHLGGRAGVGSFPWMSPEAMDMEDISYPADIFSLGVLLWELVTCNKPWGHVQRAELILTNVLMRGKRLPLDNDLFTEALSRLLSSMWAVDPRARPEALQVLRSLEEIVQDLSEPDYQSFSLFD